MPSQRRAGEPNPIPAGDDSGSPPALPEIDSKNDISMALVRQPYYPDIGTDGIQVTNERTQENGTLEPGSSSHETSDPPSSATPRPIPTEGALTVNDTGIGVANQHESRISPLFWRIISKYALPAARRVLMDYSVLISVGLWLGINAADAVWIGYFVKSASDPNPHNPTNRSNSGWIGYYTMSELSLLDLTWHLFLDSVDFWILLGRV
jgi:hypothetical protein